MSGYKIVTQPLHYRLRGSIGSWKVQKVGKSRHLLLIQWNLSNNELIFLWRVWPRFCTKENLQLFQKANVAKIMVNFQKRLRKCAVKADFLQDENIDKAKKNALSSDFNGGPLHGEIGLLKYQILFCKYLCTSCLHQILVSFRSVQLVPLCCLTTVSLAW